MQLKKVQLKDTIPVEMSKEILDKIKYLCKKIPKNEWSGILLYEVEGTIKEPKNMSIILKEIIPMDKGGNADTQYQYNEKKRDLSGYEDRMIDYYNTYPQALEENWRVGHIHSHNSMGVFFSGVDMSELEENAISHDFYLSLIVNNWLDIIAKVAFIAKTNQKVTLYSSAYDEMGKPYEIKDTRIIEDGTFYMHDCIIHSPKDEIIVNKEFAKTTEEIIKKAEIPSSPYSFGSPYWGDTTIEANRNNRNNRTYRNDFYTQRNTQYTSPVEKKSENFNNFLNKDEDANIVSSIYIKKFISILFQSVLPENLKEVNAPLFNSLISLKEYFKKHPSNNIDEKILENFYDVCSDYFGEKDFQDMEFIFTITGNVIEELETLEKEYPFLFSINLALRNMLEKMEDYGTAI